MSSQQAYRSPSSSHTSDLKNSGLPKASAAPLTRVRRLRRLVGAPLAPSPLPSPPLFHLRLRMGSSGLSTCHRMRRAMAGHGLDHLGSRFW